MTELTKYPGQLVFGLDIGTRSIVGTVGYHSGDVFHVVAQKVIEHETRAMMDGQIHDINKVGATICLVKDALEMQIDRKLTDVCIAAAGRVLRTVTTHVEYPFLEETLVEPEHIYSLELMGVEKAYEEFQEKNDTGDKFYCVGYSVVKYYLNDYPINYLENHKAKVIAADLIATFLPDEVVDGLYKAVELGGLQVANLTLEPIAAIQVAIPIAYRMLNIALVDVGAGTSDICITKDGSIIAYGMIPSAGDEITEIIAKHCLVEFAEAEKIKMASESSETIVYHDIMGLEQRIEPKEIIDLTDQVIKGMTKEIASRIKKLNGGKSVSAVFVVGGGGKFVGFTKNLAGELEINEERVAIRGEEVLKHIDFQMENPLIDSTMVTPIGICLNFYEQKNNFIFVTFNGERVKLYDNSKLAIVDAVMQAGYPNENLFPKRGKELHYFVNGKPRIKRGETGEAALVTLNGEMAGINASIQQNDKIVVRESTAGADAAMDINQLPEYDSTIQVFVNEQKVSLPKFAEVNGRLQSGYYSIQQDDHIQMLNYYTVGQILDFMDLKLQENENIYVNNRVADLDTKVYENFSVIWTMDLLPLFDEEELKYDEEYQTEEPDPEDAEGKMEMTEPVKNDIPVEDKQQTNVASSITVIVNGKPVTLSGKSSYIYVEVFDLIDFDLSSPKGKSVATMLNGRPAQYVEMLCDGDVLEIYWKD